MIYQCEKCKHTLNLTIYERQKPSAIPKKEYSCFLNNDEQYAEMYGKNIQLFRKNKADIDFETINYEFVKLSETMENSDTEGQVLVTVHNPYQLKIRQEKQIAEVLGLSRSRVKKMMEQGEIELEKNSPEFMAVRVKRGRCSGISGKESLCCIHLNFTV